ncbi:MAG: DEAD/DEAH box helicase [Actinomycetaceae bacterium]|nr:DEAD/DEAH box helicase [Actinomycetaceae bacterium]
MTEQPVTYSAGVVNLEGVALPTNSDEAKADIEEQLSKDDLAQKSFADFGVAPEFAEALSDKGITYPFPIQALTLPVALGRRDIIGQAKTGTGKTLGFGLPLLTHVVRPDDPDYAQKVHFPGLPQALVVLPTRELCKQVAGDLREAASKTSIRVTEIYGGAAFEPQIESLKRGTDIVVGTPGRLIDLLKRKTLKLTSVHTLVLDEADEMLDLGFLPDVEILMSRVPADRHVMLFSATMPGEVVALARRYMKQPTHIRAQDPADSSPTVASVKQVIYRCHALNKIEVVSRILQARERGLTIIFTRTKRTAASVARDLSSRGFATAELHGDLGQGAREQAMRAFRKGKVDVLVATDVAARGIDVDDVTHVINYQCPEDEKVYLHRIGRTGRAGASGTAVTFVDWDDVPRWGLISNALGLNLSEPLETYHTSPHLYTDLDIPSDVTGRLPRSERTREGLDSEEFVDVSGKGERGRRSRGRRGSRGERGARGRSQRNRKRTRRGGGESVSEGSSGKPSSSRASSRSSEEGGRAPRRRKRTRRNRTED